MCFFFSFLPATVWTVLGYFILFSSTKTQGGVRAFGRVLAVWVFFIAASFLLMGGYLALSGLCPLDAWLRSG